MSATEDRSIIIRGTKFEGSCPIVILGPNGSGKSTLGQEISSQNNPCGRISAKRMISLPDQLQLQTEDQAIQNYNQQEKHAKDNIRVYSSEIQQLLNKLFAEENADALQYRNSAKIAQGPLERPQENKFEKVLRLWKEVFEDREISKVGGKLEIRAKHVTDNEATYAVSSMSDGEQVALYMIARSVAAESGYLVIDEPELHLHPALAKRLWDVIENTRPEIRFVYITHDMSFAESRRQAIYIILRPKKPIEIIMDKDAFPDDIFTFLLGAASATNKSNKVIFCEGVPGGIDEQVYKAWFSDKNLTVIASGGCESVVACVEAIKTGAILKGTTAIAVIDRDDRPDEDIQHLRSKNVVVLGFSEIESVLVSKQIFFEVGKLTGEANLENKYQEFIEKTRRALSPQKNARILARSKKSAEWRMYARFGEIKNDSNIETVKGNFSEACNSIPQDINAEVIFLKETTTVENAIEDSLLMLQIFPGKSIIGVAAETLGVNIQVYKNMACKSIGETADRTVLEKGLAHLFISQNPGSGII